MKTNKTKEATASAATQVANVNETANPKANAEEVKNETSKKEKKLKKVKKAEDSKKSKKESTVKETVKAQKASLKEEVIAHREVKYIYPEDVADTLSRKAWRAKVRAKLGKLERDMYRIKDQNSKEFKKAQKEYNDYKAKVLKAA